MNDEWDISLLETVIAGCGDLFKSYNFNPYTKDLFQSVFDLEPTAKFFNPIG